MTENQELIIAKKYQQSVDILMATYNGELYIVQQISSIKAQTYSNWRLIIHDDGSSDNTVSIIKNLSKNDDRIVLIEDGIKFKSPAKNFMHLLNYSGSDRICFCDQDDIWFENKLSTMLSLFPEDYRPAALFSSGYLYNSQTNELFGKLDYKIHNLKELLFINGGIHGSRAMINGEMREKMLAYKGPLNMHDHLMSLIACSFGQIFFTEIPLFLYRQHSNNVSGNIDNCKIRRLIKGFSGLKKKYVVSKSIYDCISQFKNTYEKDLSGKDRELLDVYSNLKMDNNFIRLMKIIRYGFSVGNKGRIQLIMKLISRRYFDIL